MNDQTMTSWAGTVLQSQLPPAVKHVLLTLSCHMTDNGEFHLQSLAEFAAETSRSESAVLAALKTARDAGWVELMDVGDGKPTRALLPQS